MCLFATIIEMGSKGGLPFDLNEPPTENEDDNDSVVCFQLQKAIPSSSITKTDLVVGSTGPQGIVNNRAFSHSSSVSGFQPFIRPKVVQRSNVSAESSSVEIEPTFTSSSNLSNGQDRQAALNLQTGCVNAQATEKEEGEWSEAEGSVDACRSFIHENSSGSSDKHGQIKDTLATVQSNASVVGVENISLDAGNVKNESTNPPRVLNSETNEKKGDRSPDGQGDSGTESKEKGFRGTEATHALKCTNNLGKRPKLDQQKEVMHGKKRGRQTMFLDLEDIKQAGPLKSSTPRKQIPPPAITRTVKEAHQSMPSADCGDKQSIRDPKLDDPSSCDDNNSLESNSCKSECNGDSRSGILGPPRKLNRLIDNFSEGQASPASQQSSRKHPPDTKQLSQFSGRKPAVSSYGSTLAAKRPPSRKQTFVNQYQDSSVERLLREVTNEKFWQHPGI